MCGVLQDPIATQLYVAVKTVLNDVWHGSNALEGLHGYFYNMIPSKRCAVMLFQVSS